jgi:hypothetical protein
MTWVSPAAEEIITLGYYVSTGFYFRPSAENAYLRVSQDDDDGDVEMTTARASGAAAGAIRGSAPAVQTVEAVRRGEGDADGGVSEWNSSSSAAGGATAPTLPSSAPAGGAAAHKGGKRAGAAHAIGEEYDDDDDFDLDNLDADDAGRAGAGAGAGDDDLDAELESETRPLAKGGAGLKQVNKERR